MNSMVSYSGRILRSYKAAPRRNVSQTEQLRKAQVVQDRRARPLRTSPVHAKSSSLYGKAYNPQEDENFDAAGDSMDDADWERASAILREGMADLPDPAPARNAVSTRNLPDLEQPAEQEDYVSLQIPAPNSTTAARGKKPNWLDRFIGKVKAAWVIFFPSVPQQTSSTARDAGMNRLKVVLIADRVGMTAASFEEMKKSIVDALARYVEVAHDGDIEVTVTQDQDIGAVYSVSVPVRRVKQEARFALLESDAEDAVLDADGVSLAWDENNWDSDPSARFPYGA